MNGIYRAQNNPISADDKASKSLTWAVFEQRSSGKRFIAVSTHFMYIADLTDTECPLTAGTERSWSAMASLILRSSEKVRDGTMCSVHPLVHVSSMFLNPAAAMPSSAWYME